LELSDVTTLTIDKVGDLTLFKSDGTYLVKTSAHHVRKQWCFLLLYNWKCRDMSTNLDEMGELSTAKTEYNDYCGSPEYHVDFAAGLDPLFKATASSTTVSGDLTASEFCHGFKRDKSHILELKKDKHFNTWNRGFVTTAFMHHTQHILVGDYTPSVTPTEVGLFREMQIFMYAVFEKKVKTDKGMSLVSAYNSTRDAQAFYLVLTKHTKSATAAQLSGDTLLKYITSARYPGSWRGTSYAFVLHWK
jgi:hypothetical protein